MIGKAFNHLVRQYLKYRYRSIQQIRTNPIAHQQKVLNKLLSKGKQTMYGKQYGLNKIKDHSDYSNAMPVVEYEDIKDLIYESMDGRSNVLWPGATHWYAKSSGTTSDRSKYIPLTDDMLYKNNVAASWDSMAIVYHEDPTSEIFMKKSLVMGGSLEGWSHNKQVTVGDVSAILLKRMPAVGRPFYTPDFETALLPDWEQKIDRMVDVCTTQDVVMFGGVPTWTIVLFQRILEHTGKENMSEVWPNARYYLHGGVGFDPYVQQFQSFFPKDDFKYYEVYNASEGFFAVKDSYAMDGMLLLLDHDIFYEFIDINHLHDESPEVTPLQDVELGKNYAIVISTSSGLWRYMPGDTVTFTSVSPYRIKVSGRTKHYINVFGEEVMVANTDQAISQTIQQLPAVIKEYTVAPIYFKNKNKGGHQWVIEFEQAPDNLEAFEILLDDHLKKANSDYAAKRHKDMALKRLKIKVVPPGTFHRWLALKGKVGGQNKVPRLSNDTRYVDELLALV